MEDGGCRHMPLISIRYVWAARCMLENNLDYGYFILD